MSAEQIGILGVGASLALLIWKVSGAANMRIGKLEDGHNSLARELSE